MSASILPCIVWLDERKDCTAIAEDPESYG
jgi:hypothetical protein